MGWVSLFLILPRAIPELSRVVLYVHVKLSHPLIKWVLNGRQFFDVVPLPHYKIVEKCPRIDVIYFIALALGSCCLKAERLDTEWPFVPIKLIFELLKKLTNLLEPGSALRVCLGDAQGMSHVRPFSYSTYINEKSYGLTCSLIWRFLQLLFAPFGEIRPDIHTCIYNL